MTKRTIEIGDYITFKAATRWSYSKARRKVVSFDHLNRPCVRFGGYSDFIVKPHEISKIEKGGAA